MFSCFLRCISQLRRLGMTPHGFTHPKSYRWSLRAQVRQQVSGEISSEQRRKVTKLLGLGIEINLFYQKPAAIVQHLLEHVTSCLRRERFNDLSIRECGWNIGSYNLESLRWYIEAKELQKQNFWMQCTCTTIKNRKTIILMHSLPATENRKNSASYPQEVLATRFAVDVRDAPGSTQVRTLLHCKSMARSLTNFSGTRNLFCRMVLREEWSHLILMPWS